MKNTLPDDWLGCPNVAHGLIDDLFLPFKVPLSERYNNKIPPEEWFTPSLFFQEVQRYNIGLVVDLTATNRYYDPYHIRSRSVEHAKILVSGGRIADERLVNTFITVVDDFRRRYPDKKIAVHCTHGFNRTGYFICSYLAQKRPLMPIQDAIRLFQTKRPPGIYRQEYIDDLLRKYRNGRYERIYVSSIVPWKRIIPRTFPQPNRFTFNSVLSVTNNYRPRYNDTYQNGNHSSSRY